MKRIGVLTGGGDCPGLNAVIRAIVRRAYSYEMEVLGIKVGWKGLLDMRTEPIGMRAVTGILVKGGTILGTSRTNPFRDPEGPQVCMENFTKLDLYALIPIGGEDTLGVAARFSAMGMPIVGVPKTIDNDLSGTDLTVGFDTAVTIAASVIDRLHSTAESHNRVMVVEVMGRHAGWIATYAGIAGGADAILIPEVPFKVGDVCELIKKRHARGRDYSIVVVAEGAGLAPEPEHGITGGVIKQSEEMDAFGHIRLGGIGHFLAKEIEKRTGFEARVTVLGHIQRGGTPTPFDRILGTRLGVAAVDLVKEGKFGSMVSLHGKEIVPVPLSEVVGKTKTLDMDIFRVAEVFFG